MHLAASVQHAALLENQGWDRDVCSMSTAVPASPTRACPQPGTSLTRVVRAAAQQEFDEHAQAAAEAERKAAAQAQADAFQAEQDAFRDQMKTDAP